MSKNCEDCPPLNYPTDKTRCQSCPRGSHPMTEQSDMTVKCERYSPLFVEYIGWVIQDDLEVIGGAETEEAALLICNALNATTSTVASSTASELERICGRVSILIGGDDDAENEANNLIASIRKLFSALPSNDTPAPCGNCKLPFDECQCWEPDGPLGNSEEHAVVSSSDTSELKKEIEAHFKRYPFLEKQLTGNLLKRCLPLFALPSNDSVSAEQQAMDIDAIRQYQQQVERLNKRIAELEQPWVSVEERLPKVGDSVVAAHQYEDGAITATCCTYYDFGFPLAMWNVENPVTHWMLLPSFTPPEDRES